MAQNQENQQPVVGANAVAAVPNPLPTYSNQRGQLFCQNATIAELSLAQDALFDLMESRQCRRPTGNAIQTFNDTKNFVLNVRRAQNPAPLDERQQYVLSRTRGRDMHCTGIVFALTEDEFAAYKITSPRAFDFKDHKAWLCLKNEYYRHDRNVARQKNAIALTTQVNTRQNVETQQVENVSWEEAEAIVVTTTGQQKLTLPLGLHAIYIWCTTWDRPEMPLNPVAVGILAKREIFTGYTSTPLPEEVQLLIEAWCTHARKVENGRYATIISILCNPDSTVTEVDDLHKLPTGNYSEIHAMALALHHLLQKAVEPELGPLSAVPLERFWSQLLNVDAMARRMKILNVRDRVPATDMVCAPPEFNSPSLYFANCREDKNNLEVRAFLARLRPGVTPPVVATNAQTRTAQSQRAQNTVAATTSAAIYGPVPATGSIPPPNPAAARPSGSNANNDKARICNYCRVKTGSHSGATCPWRGKKTKKELSEMNVKQRAAGPP